MLCQKCHKQCFGLVIVPPVHRGPVHWRISLSVMPMTLKDVVPSPGVRVAVAEYRKNDLVGNEWCAFWWMKLNVIMTKTMIVSRSHTMHSQSPSTVTIGGTVLKESDDFQDDFSEASSLGFQKNLVF